MVLGSMVILLVNLSAVKRSMNTGSSSGARRVVQMLWLEAVLGTQPVMAARSKVRSIDRCGGVVVAKAPAKVMHGIARERKCCWRRYTWIG